MLWIAKWFWKRPGHFPTALSQALLPPSAPCPFPWKCTRAHHPSMKYLFLNQESWNIGNSENPMELNSDVFSWDRRKERGTAKNRHAASPRTDWASIFPATLGIISLVLPDGGVRRKRRRNGFRLHSCLLIILGLEWVRVCVGGGVWVHVCRSVYGIPVWGMFYIKWIPSQVHFLLCPFLRSPFLHSQALGLSIAPLLGGERGAGCPERGAGLRGALGHP